MHIDLFTGIGGFTLACHWHGIQTEVMCEIDERCRQFLERQWLGVPIINDIRDFDGTKWRGRFLLTGGVPCQPASRAGKQRGKGDDRWLWGEAIRVVKEAQPRWCLFENPPGIYDVGIDGILSDLEGIGYEVGICEIPACAVNAPQIRQRVWIVANAKGSNTPRNRKISDKIFGIASQGDMVDTEQTRCHRRWKTESYEGFWKFGTDCRRDIGFWSNSLWLPCADGKVRRAPDITQLMANGIFPEICDELGEEKINLNLHRSILAALGNSIVPQVAFQIIGAIVRADNEAMQNL